MITIRATECRGQLQETSDGEWLTNGHWMVRRHLCKITKTAPKPGEHRPDYTAWRGGLPAYKKYRQGRRLNLAVDGYIPLAVKDKIVAWADREYLDLLAIDWSGFWVAGELDPIAVVIGDKMQDEYVVAWLMPIRQRITPSALALLIGWLRQENTSK